MPDGIVPLVRRQWGQTHRSIPAQKVVATCKNPAAAGYAGPGRPTGNLAGSARKMLILPI
jgi:hypothetical protein